MKSFTEWINLLESTEEDRFIDAIHQTPNDTHLWLVYADWLEERGDLRAGKIRIVKRMPVPKPRKLNHLGEPQYGTFETWKRAVIGMFPTAKIEGNKDIASARFGKWGVGEWDGEVGIIYNR